MATTVLIRDETPAGAVVDQWQLVVAERLTLRELIRLRVREEVARYNAAPDGHFNGLIRPTEAEAQVNGYRMKPGRQIRWEEQADVAIAAFERNGFFVLVGSGQVDDLDAELDLDDSTDVAFVRLVPLVGG